MRFNLLFICFMLLPLIFAAQEVTNANNNHLVFIQHINHLQSHTDRFSSEIKQRLDSTLWEATFNNDELRAYTNTVYQYTNTGLTTRIDIYNFQQETQEWAHQTMNEYAYDDDNRLIQIKRANLLAPSNSWLNNYKYQYAYNDQGLADVSEQFSWSIEINDWVGNVKYEYTYNQDDDIENYFFYLYDNINDQWMSSSNGIFTYNTDHLLEKSVQWFWLPEDSTWFETNIEKTFYNEENEPVQVLALFHQLDTDEWVNNWKKERAFDENGSVSQYIFYDWIDSLSIWQNREKSEYMYDGQGNNIQTISYKWNVADSLWFEYSKMDGAYNLNYSANELLLPTLTLNSTVFYPHFNHFENMPLSTGYKKYEDGNWLDDNRWSWFYSEQDISAVNTPMQDFFKVYPVPADDFIMVEVSGNKTAILQLFDVMGRKVMEKTISGNIRIDIRNIKSGVCFYKIDFGEQVQSGKLLIR